MPHLIAVRPPSRALSLPGLPGLLPVPRAVPGALSGLVGRVRRWPVESQQAARRNAMVACTALAERRAEREDVETYLRSLPVAVHA